ncbi:hypothetical protein EVAR_44511_1 [Eumeta japonica]|uniref:Uncharacterized protein n=1 Tax=Eumeta variegata TaxID=151549 RepID=A0A4C1YJ61_EUMVA|nr:hypothetical protein EVAR_44511_1 [Eumeta japonica]
MSKKEDKTKIQWTEESSQAFEARETNLSDAVLCALPSRRALYALFCATPSSQPVQSYNNTYTENSNHSDIFQKNSRTHSANIACLKRERRTLPPLGRGLQGLLTNPGLPPRD